MGIHAEYVTEISKVLCEEFPAIRNLLSRIYFRNFCDRLAMVFLPRFLDAVTRCKRVNEMAAQQLLLDLHDRYFKFVNRAVEKADMMLKLLGTPVSYLAASFHDM